MIDLILASTILASAVAAPRPATELPDAGGARERKLALARQIAADGIVLLENRGNALPLAKGETVALVGITGYFCHRMGWGSGDMMAHRPVQYDEGLERAGVVLDPAFATVYRDALAKRIASGEYDRVNLDWMKWTSRFEEPDFPDAAFAAAAKGRRGEKCVVVIGRNGGESEDLRDDFGSFRLHAQEENLLRNACASFRDVIVVLNTCGVIDTSFMDRYPVKALVYASLLGEVSGLAVADVLTGDVNPSGKTVDTWAKRYRDYPTTDCFGTLEVPYDEGVFVGYRHFATAGVEPRYAFGHGLSYTDFAVEPKERGRVKVTNVGKVPGADVVQCYVATPSKNLDQPRYKLCSFAKTKVLRPLESEIVSVATDPWINASWCEKCGGWALEEGRYWFLVGDSMAYLKEAWTVDVPKMTVKKPDAKPSEPAKPLPRAARTVTMKDVLDGTATAEELVSRFDDDELALILNGRVFDEGFTVAGGTGVGGVKAGRVRNEAGEFWSSEKYGLPAFTCADGPSGVRLGNFGEPVTNFNPCCAEMVHWPCGTALAQGWNVGAAEDFGRAVADDMAIAGIDGWLAPGVNIHRNPLCGRNFEYFSEDPLLAGKMGAAVVRGVETRPDGRPSGRYATVKHFCTNGQEFQRAAEMNEVGERALREIYLKPFEIVVREGRPHALMTSYNRLNGDYVATTRRLVTEVLRGEWGFEGLVMTDWWNSADKLRHPAAGNDIVMPGVRAEVEALIGAIRSGRVRRADAQACAVRIVRTLASLMKENPR